jgi:hypothetical protein
MAMSVYYLFAIYERYDNSLPKSHLRQSWAQAGGSADYIEGSCEGKARPAMRAKLAVRCTAHAHYLYSMVAGIHYLVLLLISLLSILISLYRL